MRALVSLALLLSSACAAGRGAAPLAAAPPPLVELQGLLAVEGGAVSIAPEVRALAGARARVRGWLVVFEEPPGDGFWLVARPVRQDESGAGSGDLPPRAVRVAAPPEVIRALPQEPVPLEAAGRLEVGREVDGEGRPSLVRLVVEDPRDVLRLTPPR